MSQHERSPGTDGEAYYDRLRANAGRWWKRVLPVQLPYQWHLRRQRLGRTLDVGCGLGRNLRSLGPGSMGIDHNEFVVEFVRRQGLRASTVQAFYRGAYAKFDALLFAHVLEHMERAEAGKLVNEYLPNLREGGSVLVICPQARGFASDPTHVWFATERALVELLEGLGLTVMSTSSFPLPRAFGRAFIYNETWVRARFV